MGQHYIHIYFQLLAQLVLMLLHVSAVNCSHLQGATSVEGMYSVLYRLSNTKGEIFLHISVNKIVLKLKLHIS
jgi:hypothetical protein